jgi:type II secretory pathway pseudopilin PulG
MKTTGQAGSTTAGYAMAALLVTLAVMAVAMTVALPAWRHEVQRENEEELIFRGRQYVRAVQLFQRRYAAAYAPDVDTLVNQKCLRKEYTDPMVKDGEFEILYQGSIVAGSAVQLRAGVQPGQAP